MSAVARRYATALFALAKEADSLQPAAEQLQRLTEAASAPAVAPVLCSPLLSAAHRQELARTLARELALSDLLTRFVRLLADHQRLDVLPAIEEHFQRLLDRELGRVRITLQSAGPLDAKQEGEIIATFSRLTGKQVIPRMRVDPELLGGVVAEVEGKVYDGSVRAQLDRLAKELIGGSAR